MKNPKGLGDGTETLSECHIPAAPGLTDGSSCCIVFVDTKGETDMETHVKKWGNSLSVRIPKPFAAEIGLEDNSTVELSLAGGRLIITPIAESHLSLEGLLAQIAEDNLHREVDTGPAVGGEVW
jgi:antitoxin MazE